LFAQLDSYCCLETGTERVVYVQLFAISARTELNSLYLKAVIWSFGLIPSALSADLSVTTASLPPVSCLPLHQFTRKNLSS
jgi:hypothetical protein